jgi:hypothetical protein
MMMATNLYLTFLYFHNSDMMIMMMMLMFLSRKAKLQDYFLVAGGLVDALHSFPGNLAVLAMWLGS